MNTPGGSSNMPSDFDSSNDLVKRKIKKRRIIQAPMLNQGMAPEILHQ